MADRLSPKLIAVIGHGRSPEDRTWGPMIDACDVVVRMWNWHWQHPADFGTKYDYGLIDVARPLIDRFHEHNRFTPAIGWIGSPHPSSRFCRTPSGIEMIDPKPWHEMAKSMGGFGPMGRLEFTRGTQAACWAITKCAEPGDRVVLVGFDYVVLGRSQPVEQAASPSYLGSPGEFPFTEQSYRENVRRFGFTDYGIEFPVMHRLAEERSVILVLAQGIWP